jgi:hypothetical protein
VIPEQTLLQVIGLGAYGEVWFAHNAGGTPRAVKMVQADPRPAFGHLAVAS